VWGCRVIPHLLPNIWLHWGPYRCRWALQRVVFPERTWQRLWWVCGRGGRSATPPIYGWNLPTDHARRGKPVVRVPPIGPKDMICWVFLQARRGLIFFRGISWGKNSLQTPPRWREDGWPVQQRCGLPKSTRFHQIFSLRQSTDCTWQRAARLSRIESKVAVLQVLQERCGQVRG